MNATKSTPPSPDAEEVMRKCAAILSEHYDSVQILASHVKPDGKTGMAMWGSGNYYARVQMAQTFVDRDRAEHIADYVVRGLQN